MSLIRNIYQKTDILNSKWAAFPAFPYWQRSWVFALTASVLLGLICSMRLDSSKDIEPVKQGQTVLYADLKVRILPTLQRYNKGLKTNIHKYQWMWFA